MTTIIVQPWFTAIGHPAQTTLNTARVLGSRDDVTYLLARENTKHDFDDVAREVAKYGDVAHFTVPSDSLHVGTLLGVRAASCLARALRRPVDLLFLDAQLVVLALAWPVLGAGSRLVRTVSAIELNGPERIVDRRLRRLAVRRLLARHSWRLYLRTEELASAWRDAFPEIAPSRIDTLPSLEIPDPATAATERPHAAASDGRTKFAVLGQIRPGKSLDWLVPLFRRQPDLGALHVAGAFTNASHRQALRVLDDYPDFDNRFVPEDEMLATAASQDYLVALYDDWDTRMEAATFFLAARVDRPVIAYDEGWCGRMIRRFGCGVVVPRHPRPDREFFRSLPKPETSAYIALREGMTRFREAYSGSARRSEFLRKLGLDGSPSSFGG